MLRFYLVVLLVGFSFGQKKDFWSHVGTLLSSDDSEEMPEAKSRGQWPPCDKDSDSGTPVLGQEYTIERPCPALDLNCVRRFFVQNSNCNPVYGPAPDPYFIKRLELPIPHANITIIWVNAEVKGLKDGKVLEFYVNRETRNLVLELEFDSIAAVSPDAIVRYHRKGKEPVDLSDTGAIIFKSMSLTLTVPINNEIEMSKAKIYTYIGESDVPVMTGRGWLSSDNELQEAYNKLLNDLSASMRESALSQGPVYFAVFLETSICSYKPHLSITDWAHQIVRF